MATKNDEKAKGATATEDEEPPYIPPPTDEGLSEEEQPDSEENVILLPSARDIKLANGSDMLPSYLEQWDDTIKRLREPFNPEDVYFLPQGINYDKKTAVAAAYADSRVYTARLNSVIGPAFWQSRMEHPTTIEYLRVIKEKLDWKTKEVTTPARDVKGFKFGLIALVGIWMGPVLGWVFKDSTGAKASDDENWITSAEAQAYKRACSKWGPGEYFYRFGKRTYDYDTKTGKWKTQPEIPSWAYPTKTCVDCTKELSEFPYRDKDGNVQTMSKWKVYQRGLQNFNTSLCGECQIKRKQATTDPKTSERFKS